MNGAGLCRIGMAIVVLTAVAHAQVAPKKEENRAPIVTDGMTTGEFGQILEKARAMEKAKSCGQRIRERGKPFSLEELAGAKVKRIRVVRAETYKIWPAPKPEQAREMIEKVWSRKFGWMACQIEWDEGALWSVEAELEFEDGKKGALITDGWHVAIQDHEGHNWFGR